MSSPDQSAPSQSAPSQSAPSQSAPYQTANARPLGEGFRCPVDSLLDVELAARAGGYRRRVASSYRALSPDELHYLPPGEMHVTPKMDGQLWYLVLDPDQAFLMSPRGAVLFGGLPLLKEAHGLLSKISRRTIIAGELIALRKEGRPRCGDIGAALGSDDDVGRIAFFGFDLLEGGPSGKEGPFEAHDDRMAGVEALLGGGKRLRVVPQKKAHSPDEVAAIFREWAEGGKGEGLVARAADGRIYKVKPIIHIDCVVVGYTIRGEDPSQVRSVLLGLIREGGAVQLVGSCGNFGPVSSRQELLKQIQPLDAEADYRQASRDGALYRFVKPELVMEIRISDVQSEDSKGLPVRQMVLDFRDGRWKALRQMPSVSLIHPRFTRLREDKAVTREEVRIEQVLERCVVEGASSAVEALTLPPSELLRREVYVKTTKGQRAVRKLLVWCTHKQEASPDYPAFVTCLVDYSPGRKDPIKRTVKPAPTAEVALRIADELIAQNIKRGWDPVAP